MQPYLQSVSVRPDSRWDMSADTWSTNMPSLVCLFRQEPLPNEKNRMVLKWLFQMFDVRKWLVTAGVNFLFSGEVVKEFGSSLEVRRIKERTQSLSNIDILISPCDQDHKASTCAASPQSDNTDANVEKPAEKTRLEAAVSFPLERSKVSQYSPTQTLSTSPSSDRKSISSIVYSPAHQDQEWAVSVTPLNLQQAAISSSLPHCGVHPSPGLLMEKSKGDETKQEVEDRMCRPSDREHGGEMVDSHDGIGCREEPSEEDQTFPTLRSKSLNANPRKTRMNKKSKEEPRLAGSAEDLVSKFTGGKQWKQCDGASVSDKAARGAHAAVISGQILTIIPSGFNFNSSTATCFLCGVYPLCCEIFCKRNSWT